MSYYTIFDQMESVLTATSTGTATLGSSDTLIVHNWASGKKFQLPLSSVGSLSQPITYYTTTIFTAGTTAVSLGAYSTSGSSAFIPNTGLSIILATAGTTCNWALADPTVTGQVKQIVLRTSTTSTLYGVTPVAATILSSGSQAGTLINLASTNTGSNAGNGVTLTALSTTTWLVTGKSMTASAVSSAVVLAAGLGPILT